MMTRDLIASSSLGALRQRCAAVWKQTLAGNTQQLSSLRRATAACGIGLHDDGRRGDKGLHDLGTGFATTSTGAAMRTHFRAAGACRRRAVP